jgi:REP element-mobilizing transposase RayT
MPEHFHLLIWPSKAQNPSRIVGSLKQRTARHIIENLKRSHDWWCRHMLTQIVLPETVHDQSTYRVWQRRFYRVLCVERIKAVGKAVPIPSC